MIINEEKTNIRQFYFRADRSDPEYYKCTWARFYLDLDHFTLMIESDCGNFCYGWPITPSENFVTLMSRVEDGYFMSKISSEVFDSDKTIKNILEDIKENNEDYYEEIRSSLIEYGDFDTEDESYFDMKLDELFDDYYPYLSEYHDIGYSEYHAYRYPAEAETITNIFCKYI